MERAGKDVGLLGRGRLFLAGVTAQAGAGRLQRAGCGQVSGYSPTGAERRGDCERRERNARLLLRVDADQSPTTRGPCPPGLRRGLCSRAPREPRKGLKAGGGGMGRWRRRPREESIATRGTKSTTDRGHARTQCSLPPGGSIHWSRSPEAAGLRFKQSRRQETLTLWWSKR